MAMKSINKKKTQTSKPFTQKYKTSDSTQTHKTSAMKEPSLSRFHKKPTSKLKLVCSFNGGFDVRPPSNKLRYIGGETRIVSVDRNISFSKLRLKISDICPNIRSFTLRYQLPLTGRSCKDTEDDDDMPLVLIASDDDFKCMVDEYDKLELYGEHARLWVFVCSQIECGSNFRVKKESNEDLLRKTVLKQHLFAKQTKKDYEHQCMDSHLNTQPHFSTLHTGPYGEKILLFNGVGNGRLNPLNLRDVNLRVETNDPMELLVGRSSSGLCYGGGNKTGNTGQPSLPSKEAYGCGVVSTCNGFDGKHFNGKGQVLASNINRENIMPWAVNCGSVKTHLPSNCNNQHAGSIYPRKPLYFGDRFSGSCHNGIQNHRLGAYDSGNHRNYPYRVKNHRNNFVEAENYRGVILDSMVGTCYLGIQPYSNILDQRQSMGLNDSSLLKPSPGLAEHASDGRMSLMAPCLNKDIYPLDIQYGKATFREQGGPVILQYGNSNTLDSHLTCHELCSGVANQSFPTYDTVKVPSSCVREIKPWEDLLTGSEFEKNEAPYDSLHENIHGMSTNYASNHSDLETEKLLVGSLENANISGPSNEMDHRNGAKLSCSLTNGTKNLQGRIASSMDFLCNLSLSSSKEIDTFRNSSVSGNVVSDVLLKSHSKPLDPVDKGLLSAGAVVDESNRVRSSFSQNAAKARRVDVHGEEVQKDLGLCPEGKGDTKVSYEFPKIIGGFSSDLTAFFAHSTAGELQTIKYSDLEYIKELASGTFGTVFYGKWRGSDVAIKRMKPNCFTDQLVSDFWREAHMLGLLHHPNIVALYGVVTDEPETNFAAVTEYMVNGSLKQVLQRKDRTIDRRKRLIIATDAAFGMEYLHEKNIVHFDLKSHNFLVNMRDPQRPVCKIGDLGLSKIKQKTLISGGVRGTIPWMAPELLNNKSNLVTEKIDVYSFGVVMWELLTGEELYANLHSEEIIAGIIKGTLRPKIPNWCDPSWRSLMERCWSSDANSRPAFSEISKELRAMAVAMNIK